jgi:hypothetical protein
MLGLGRHRSLLVDLEVVADALTEPPDFLKQRNFRVDVRQEVPRAALRTRAAAPVPSRLNVDCACLTTRRRRTTRRALTTCFASDLDARLGTRSTGQEAPRRTSRRRDDPPDSFGSDFVAITDAESASVVRRPCGRERADAAQRNAQASRRDRRLDGCDDYVIDRPEDGHLCDERTL